MPTPDPFWPNGARLAVSCSLMFEGGGQPISGAPGFFQEPMEKGPPDLATNGVFQYGVYEGIPRILDLMDKHRVKLSSVMTGQAVDRASDLAREIVRRGHGALKDGFDQLYEEGAYRRRMMVVGLHDRISGHANRVRVLDRFLTYARSKPGVWFARKDEIAVWALEHREITPIYDRGAPTVTGLPGSAA